jgi:hypothetical protein
MSTLLEAMLDAEGALNLGELARAKAVDGDDLAVGDRLQSRDMIGDRPPAGADDSNTRAASHAPLSCDPFIIDVPSPR